MGELLEKLLESKNRSMLRSPQRGDWLVVLNLNERGLRRRPVALHDKGEFDIYPFNRRKG